jgi:hypothetical protein
MKGITYALVVGASSALLGCGGGAGAGTDYFMQFFPAISADGTTILQTTEDIEFDGIAPASAAKYSSAKSDFEFIYTSNDGATDGTCTLPFSSAQITNVINTGDELGCSLDAQKTTSSDLFMTPAEVIATLDIKADSDDSTVDMSYTVDNGELAPQSPPHHYVSSFSMSDLFDQMPPLQSATSWDKTYEVDYSDAGINKIAQYKTSLQNAGFTDCSPLTDEYGNVVSKDSWTCKKTVNSHTVYSVSYYPYVNNPTQMTMTPNYLSLEFSVSYKADSSKKN